MVAAYSSTAVCFLIEPDWYFGARMNGLHSPPPDDDFLQLGAPGWRSSQLGNCLVDAIPILTLLLLVTALAGHAEATEKEKKAYIVYMGERLKNMEPLSIPSLHKSLLNQVIKSDDGASTRLIHSYGKSFNAFAAMLTENEAESLSNMDEVVSVFPSQQRELHTTRSWDFMSFPTTATHSAFESDVIIGMLDTGIWPESQSFDDAGFGPPPHKWKGTCQTSNNNFTCNNKIIGARYYHLVGSITGENIPSPRDSQGHGTHTASTAAGRLVANASLSGLAEGTARGGVPSARLAVYKVCWKNQGCSDVDILAGFDDAIADGVDIISISVGWYAAIQKYFSDPIAIGSFHAVKNGILVSSSAGNTGPDRYSVVNSAPWILTVAASTIDRKFIAQVKLGNGDAYQGVALNIDSSNGTLYPLIKASDAPNTSAGFDSSTAMYCSKGSLDEDLTQGKVVICEHFNIGLGPQVAGAVGAIMPPVDTVISDYAIQFKLPASELEVDDVDKIIRYSNTTSHPMASVGKSEGVFDGHAPYVSPTMQ
ncbi:cucumisin-like [Dendrobium catenatum]|nr:cucumisin-like [Dendrobium catenatum]